MSTLSAGVRMIPLLCLLLLAISPFNTKAQEMTLEYLGHYRCQEGVDHLLDVCPMGDGLAMVTGTPALTVVDLNALPVGGTQSYAHRSVGWNARDVLTADGRYFFVNIQRSSAGENNGFAVVEWTGSALVERTSRFETDVIYERMALHDDLLLVAAHSHGLLIFDVSDPVNPDLLGSCTLGLTDAFAVAAVGSTAYVADGAGGLKLVNIADPTLPEVSGGENLATALGTAEDITCRDGHVYMAAGSAGLAYYANGNPAARRLFPVSSCARDLTWLGDHLALTDMAGLQVYRILPDGTPVLTAGEIMGRREQTAELRITNGTAAVGDTIICANWDYLDLYRLVPLEESTQGDITASTSRLRFPFDGGSKSVTIRNDGGANLHLPIFHSSSTAFTSDFTTTTLAPGEFLQVEIQYDPGAGSGSGVIGFTSNDPDENPLPIQVFGATGNLDPGEPATDFTLPRWRYVDGVWSEEEFTLSEHLGKVVWFQAFGTW